MPQDLHKLDGLSSVRGKGELYSKVSFTMVQAYLAKTTIAEAADSQASNIVDWLEEPGWPSQVLKLWNQPA